MGIMVANKWNHRKVQKNHKNICPKSSLDTQQVLRSKAVLFVNIQSRSSSRDPKIRLPRPIGQWWLKDGKPRRQQRPSGMILKPNISWILHLEYRAPGHWNFTQENQVSVGTVSHRPGIIALVAFATGVSQKYPAQIWKKGHHQKCLKFSKFQGLPHWAALTGSPVEAKTL